MLFTGKPDRAAFARCLAESCRRREGALPACQWKESVCCKSQKASNKNKNPPGCACNNRSRCRGVAGVVTSYYSTGVGCCP